MVNMNMMGQMPGVQDTSEMAMQQAMAAQQQAQLQARGMQQPTYQTNGVNPAFAAVTNGVMGDVEARNKSMQGLI
tara:strand:+ start:51 stop:275 length:225 start_codon:yes stop_codon:yes gene_type:complete